MSALIEHQELIDVVVGTIAKMKGGSSASSHSFHTQHNCKLYEGVGPLTFEQLPPKVRDAISILLSPLNNDLIPEHQQFQRDWTGNFPDKNNGRSDGDLTLCGSLAQAGLQSKEIDMALRASGRYREKWEREDYWEGLGGTVTEKMVTCQHCGKFARVVVFGDSHICGVCGKSAHY